MIPNSLRRIENLHILFWLIKDLCWISDLKIPGLLMILPTAGIALWMTIRFRSKWSEFAHNFAITCWIIANSIWMIGEFYFDDGIRPLARWFFLAGLIMLCFYYGGLLFRRSGNPSAES